MNWKIIKEHDSYYISDTGLIKNDSGKILKPTNNTGGYKSYHGRAKCKSVTIVIHRYVAKYFLKDWDPKLQVNHIDGDKSNNDLSNLEMVTPKENVIHAHKNGLVNNSSGDDHYRTKYSDELSLKIFNEVKKIKIVNGRREYGAARRIADIFNVPIYIVHNMMKKDGLRVNLRSSVETIPEGSTS